MLRSTRSARALYQLVPGRTVRAQTTADGRLLELRYRNGGNVLTVAAQRATASASPRSRSSSSGAC